MSKTITSFVDLDTHVDSIAIGVAPSGRREPRCVGTVSVQWHALAQALGRLGTPEALQIVYEAGPCGYILARQLRAHGYVWAVFISAGIVTLYCCAGGHAVGIFATIAYQTGGKVWLATSKKSA